MVGATVLAQDRLFNGLRKVRAKSQSLKSKGLFSRCPHLFVELFSMIEWSDEAIAAALRVWLRLSEVGEFRDVRWRETMRQALEAAVEAQNRPDVMGNSLAKALLRATDLEIEVHRLKVENVRMTAEMEELCKSKLGRLAWYKMRDEEERAAMGESDDYAR